MLLLCPHCDTKLRCIKTVYLSVNVYSKYIKCRKCKYCCVFILSESRSQSKGIEHENNLLDLQRKKEEETQGIETTKRDYASHRDIVCNRYGRDSLKNDSLKNAIKLTDVIKDLVKNAGTGHGSRISFLLKEGLTMNIKRLELSLKQIK